MNDTQSSDPPAAPPMARPRLREHRTSRLKMMVLGIATALVIVAVALPRTLPAPAEHIVVPRQLASEPAVAQTLPPAPALAADTASAPVTPARTPAKKTSAPAPRANRPVESANAARMESSAATLAQPEPAPAAAPAPAVAAGPSPVTITGCLEMTVDQTEFRLTDTDGAEAPKARSWRSGFLKKRSAPIELLDAQDAHALVGKRVAATGLMASGSMKVSALRLVTPSCS